MWFKANVKGDHKMMWQDWRLRRAADRRNLTVMNKAFGSAEARMRAMYGPVEIEIHRWTQVDTGKGVRPRRLYVVKHVKERGK